MNMLETSHWMTVYSVAQTLDLYMPSDSDCKRCKMGLGWEWREREGEGWGIEGEQQNENKKERGKQLIHV